MATNLENENNSTDTLETWLYKATNPLNTTDDWEAIVGFCDQINKDLEGPQTAVRLLIHKIQSPNEKESLMALTTLEACGKNCGRRFQQEIGKFRFINEIIKVVSPKYLGNFTTEKVKKKCIELLYNWSEVLGHEPKIKEAYQMLRRQGIIKEDPVPPEIPPAPPSPPPQEKNSVFQDEEKSKLLSRLLKSKNPDDLQAANRLIKNMVKQDAERQEKVSKRLQQLETVNNNAKLLSEMLNNHEPGGATESDKEIMRELYNNLESQRPNLFRLASDTDERDGEGISDILKANDEVIRVMSLYDQIVNKNETNEVEQGASAGTKENSNVDVLKCLQDNNSSDLKTAANSVSFLDDQLLSLGLGSSNVSVNGRTNGTSDDLSDLFGPVSTNNSSSQPVLGAGSHTNTLPPSLFGAPAASALPPPLYTSKPSAAAADDLLLSLSGSSSQVLHSIPPAANTSTSINWFSSTSTTTSSTSTSTSVVSKQQISAGLESIDEISKSLLQQNKSSNVEWKQFKPAEPVPKLSLNQMSKASTAAVQAESSASSSLTTADLLGPSLLPPPTLTPSSSSNDLLSLDDVSVSIESIRPGSISAQTVYDKNDIKIVLHFGKDRPRPDVQVIAISITSTNTSPVNNFLFQASVPKVLKVKLQPASGSDLPGYNPILPPSAITQVMLIAHPPQEPVRLKFKISFTCNDNDITDIGELASLIVG